MFAFSVLLVFSTAGIFAQISFNDFYNASTDQAIARQYYENVIDLLDKVNDLLYRAGIYSVSISAAARTGTKTGAASYDGLHNYGRAIDIVDRDGSIYRAIAPLIQGSNLRLENKNSTPTWVHLDIGREGVANDVKGGRIFNP
jgi:hypothetical protein